MRSRAGRGIRASLLVVLGLAAGCYTFHWGADPDRTLYRVIPEPVPEEARVEGTPWVWLLFEGAFLLREDGAHARDPRSSATFLRLLRRTGLFAAVEDTPASVLPAGAVEEPRWRGRLELAYAEDDHTAGNLVKAATMPGFTGYRHDLDGTMRLVLEPPGTDEPLVVEATTSLTRLYHHADGRDAARHRLLLEVDRLNFLNVVDQLRAEPRLVAPAL